MNAELNTANSGRRSAIGRLLDILIKHGTLPNMPTPELITNAQTELADYELRLDLLAKGATWEHNENESLKDEIARLQRIKELAREVHKAVDVTMGLFTSSGIDLQTYLNLRIGDLKEAHEALASALKGDAK